MYVVNHVPGGETEIAMPASDKSRLLTGLFGEMAAQWLLQEDAEPEAEATAATFDDLPDHPTTLADRGDC